MTNQRRNMIETLIKTAIFELEEYNFITKRTLARLQEHEVEVVLWNEGEAPTLYNGKPL